jgi:hypothetical protein
MSERNNKLLCSLQVNVQRKLAYVQMSSTELHKTSVVLEEELRLFGRHPLF